MFSLRTIIFLRSFTRFQCSTSSNDNFSSLGLRSKKRTEHFFAYRTVLNPFLQNRTSDSSVPSDAADARSSSRGQRGSIPPHASPPAERGSEPSAALSALLCSASAAPSWLLAGSVPVLLSLQGRRRADFKSHGICHSARIFASLQLQAVAICAGEGGKKTLMGFCSGLIFLN